MDEMKTDYHEAGHAVIGYLCYGERIDRITIKPFIEDGNLILGRCRWLVDNASETAVAMLFAGDLAERVLRRDNPITYQTAAWTGDFEIAKMMYDADDYPGLYEITRDRLITKWQTVEALAKALIKGKTIQGPEAEAILKQEI